MQYPLLDTIKYPSDLRKLKESDLPDLARELRSFILDVVSVKEGHLGASLGVVELTIAIHYIFNTPIDQLVWDVGHQAYGHKILTGRKAVFDTNRQLHGVSGFPKRSESEYDTFGTGHSSTSISAALGMAIAAKLQGDEERQHIAVIGDASIASGMAFEALNHTGVSDANLLIILNDNAIGIDPSVGALKEYLTKVKTDRSAARNNIIQALNIEYNGPVDGHNLPKLLRELKRLRKKKGPQFLHIITTKGKGLKQAEEDQVRYHAPGKFDRKTGELLKSSTIPQPPKFQDVFGETLTELAAINEKIVGITPAMPTGSSMKIMMDKFPERAIDVGIAEQHAVTLAAGMATSGLIPYCNIYSTFLQRAYDQVIHDVALQNLPVIFCLDRAGLVGQDGATHHGVFDLAYLRCIPNIIIYAPRDEAGLRNMLYTAQLEAMGPIAIRYPRGRGDVIDWKKPFKRILIGKGERLKKGSHIAIVTIGVMAGVAQKALKFLTKEEQMSIGHYDLKFLKPLDEDLLHEIFKSYKNIITLEDGTIKGGMGDAILEFASKHQYNSQITKLGVPDEFIEQGTIQELREISGIDEKNLAQELKRLL
ncbi:1-deoxy-D-xylulose-5-phosphate synthase [Robertkochia solimangrovi]|uniref:1-deoxy-D-xylulose-5-phosphate synthase n=1 Tax=Robertkochia solimangrovi TaxID=2213046 RepID=UPI00117F1B50|nr:1-deoxy-D-xylulose-5-phosphate synthase [Robertkochia solimangrovi]TRZ45927.1 1-deoxy-D-xylulose-5-phosphate synthase [Robertkochia solimangrovi]